MRKPDNLARSQARQIFFLLFFRAEIHDRQQTDAAVAPQVVQIGILRDVIAITAT